MKKNKLRNQDKDKINKINQNQIMNLFIIRIINYKNKNKDKKFNNAFKAEVFENKNEFKSHNKNKNKSETKFKKSNETSMSMLMSNNAEKKNSHILIVIIVKNSIHNHAFISILSLQKKNDEKSIRLK